MSTVEQIEALAADIGEIVYIDVAKWHLYLSTAKLHTPLAEAIYSLAIAGDISRAGITDILKDMKISLGDGKLEVDLLDLVPARCQSDLMDFLEDYQRSL
ncbi:MAG: DUF3181 family protein [Cyanobacteria bacterium P01_C01_bin.89]